QGSLENHHRIGELRLYLELVWRDEMDLARP
ncbi:MAG: hypothetical protein ACI9OW_000568, partial [Marinobacter psychrophilus]